MSLLFSGARSVWATNEDDDDEDEEEEDEEYNPSAGKISGGGVKVRSMGGDNDGNGGCCRCRCGRCGGTRTACGGGGAEDADGTHTKDGGIDVFSNNNSTNNWTADK